MTIFNLGYFQANFLNGSQEQHINCMDLAIKNAKESDTLSNQRFSGFDEQHSSITTLSCSSGSYSQSSRQMVMMARKLEKKHDTSWLKINAIDPFMDLENGKY